MKQIKSIIILCLLCMLSTGLWANDITYTATESIGAFENSAFDLPVQSLAFDQKTHVGYVFFSGDVTKIYAFAFQERTTLLTVTLPNTITTIGNDAFQNCRSMTSVNIPEKVTTIGNGAFSLCSKLTSITIPSSVTSIGIDAFGSCSSLSSVTFEGTACQNAIGANIFNKVGSAEQPATLTLPNDWDYDKAPANSTTPWYGEYFISNFYSTDGVTEKQDAIDEITALLGEYATSDYLQTILAEETAKINGAANRPQLAERKQAAKSRIELVVDNYAAGKAEALGPLGTEQPGPAVKVTKGDTEVILYLPDKVEYIIRK